jgi:hypothetical protein
MLRILLTVLVAGFPGIASLYWGGETAHAQMYPQDIHSQHRPLLPSTQQPFGGMGMDGVSSSQQRRAEEERERREMLERQRRMAENFTNIPDQLREPYPRRYNPPQNFR